MTGALLKDGKVPKILTILSLIFVCIVVRTLI